MEFLYSPVNCNHICRRASEHTSKAFEASIGGIGADYSRIAQFYLGSERERRQEQKHRDTVTSEEKHRLYVDGAEAGMVSPAMSSLL